MNLPAAELAAIYGIAEVALSLRKRAGGESAHFDRGSLRLLWIVISCSLVAGFWASIAIPQAGMGSLIAPARNLGVVLFVAGLILRWYAIIYLGRLFTVNVAIAADHRLIDSGPYRHIRHPSYSGALMVFLGVGLCSGNWLAVAVLIVPISMAFIWRIHVEESAMLRGLGVTYRDYMGRTKRLIPAIY